MSKRTTAGARWIKNERARNNREDVVITNSIKYESEIVRISDTVVRRKRK